MVEYNAMIVNSFSQTSVIFRVAKDFWELSSRFSKVKVSGSTFSIELSLR